MVWGEKCTHFLAIFFLIFLVTVVIMIIIIILMPEICVCADASVIVNNLQLIFFRCVYSPCTCHTVPAHYHHILRNYIIMYLINFNIAFFVYVCHAIENYA